MKKLTMKKKFFVILFIVVCLTAVALSRPSDFVFAKNSDFGGSDALYSMLKEERDSLADGSNEYTNLRNGEIYGGPAQSGEIYSEFTTAQSGGYNSYTYTENSEFYSAYTNAQNDQTYSAQNEKILDAALGNSVSKRLIVKAEDKINSFGAVYSARIGGFYVFQYEKKESAERAYAYFSSQKSVESVEFDAPLYISEYENTDIQQKNALSGAATGDYTQQKSSLSGAASTGMPGYSYLSWGASATGADRFSSYLLTSRGLENLPAVTVAVVDSGVDAAHSVFSGRIADGGKNFSTSTASASIEYKDDNGHGTHVSGIIADMTLPNVKILPLKVINKEGAASVTSIIAALVYLTELKADGANLRAVNLSLSGKIAQSSTSFALYKSVLENLYRQNVIPVAAAGNDSQNASDYAPGNIECALTISAVDSSLDPASYSNYGTLVDFAAPGSSVNSAALNGGTTYLSGTSMAAPHVTAVVALLYSNPKNAAMTSKQAEAYLKSIAIDLGNAGKDDQYGNGFISLGYAPSYIPTPPTDGEQTVQEEISGISVVSSPENTAENIENSQIFAVDAYAPLAVAVMTTVAALYVFVSRFTVRKRD
jgi:hypothetical protein